MKRFRLKSLRPIRTQLRTFVRNFRIKTIHKRSQPQPSIVPPFVSQFQEFSQDPTKPFLLQPYIMFSNLSDDKLKTKRVLPQPSIILSNLNDNRIRDKATKSIFPPRERYLLGLLYGTSEAHTNNARSKLFKYQNIPESVVNEKSIRESLVKHAPSLQTIQDPIAHAGNSAENTKQSKEKRSFEKIDDDDLEMN